MPKKIRELKAALRRAGFTEEYGTGSHVNFWYEGVAGTYVTVSGQDGHDAQRYQEAAVRRVVEQAKAATGSGG